MDLHGELARRLDDERADLMGTQWVLAPADQLEQRHQERECLPGAGRGLHDDVHVLEQAWDGRLLHRHGAVEAVRRERLEHRRRERGLQVGE